MVDDKGKVEMDDESWHMMINFFKDMCPEQLFLPEGCNDPDCFHLTHDLPNAEYLARRLRCMNYKSCHNIYKLVVRMFPRDLRDYFMPAFVEFFVEHRLTNYLRDLVRDHQKSSPDFGFDTIVEGMMRVYWSRADAIRFIINNHSDSPQARIAITKLIGNSGGDAVKFVDYLSMLDE